MIINVSDYRCPKCKKFYKFETAKEFSTICEKCGVELKLIANYDMDTEKAKEIALKQAKNIKAKAEELYRYAIEKSTPVVEKAADEVRKQSLKVVKEIEKKLEDENKSKK